MRTKIALIFILITVSIVSCVKDDDGCGGPFPNLFKVTGIDWESGLAEQITTAYDTSYKVINIEDTIPYNNFGIVAKLTTELFYGSSNRFSFFPSAFACSPAEPSPADTILGINVITNQDFNEKHSKGTDVSAFFNVFTRVYTDQDWGNKKLLSLYEFNRSNSLAPRHELFLLLKGIPTSEINRSFTVKIKLKGETLRIEEFTTDKVLILTK